MGVEEVLAEAKSRIEELIAPINGGVGEDISYNEQFEALKSEAEKMQSLTGETPNWGNMETSAAELLSEKSKDFRVACYLAAAKGRAGTTQELLDALVLVNELDKAFWDTMHPPAKRMRARAGMFQWFIEVVGPLAIDFKLTTKDSGNVEALEQVQRELEADLREKMGDLYPGFGRLRDAIRHLVSTCPKEAPPPPPPPPPPLPGEAPAAPAASAQEPAPTYYAASSGSGEVVTLELVTDASAAADAIPKAGLLLARIGTTLRAAKPENPEAYRLTRMGMWLELVDTPVVVDGNTLVPAPPSDLKDRFETLASSENWLDLLNEAEETASQFILWLDPHRYVAMAMDRMGALFMKAKKAMLLEMAILLQRLPVLPKLTYNAGEPFADGPTKMWLETEVATVLGSGGGGGGGGGGVVSEIADKVEEAKGLVVQGKLAEAIELVARAAATASSPAEKFRGRVALAQLCLRAGKFDIARAQLDGLHRVIEAHQLAVWEPALCADVYAALYAAHLGLNAGGGASPEAYAAQQVAFERLCELDAATALKLVEGGG